MTAVGIYATSFFLFLVGGEKNRSESVRSFVR